MSFVTSISSRRVPSSVLQRYHRPSMVVHIMTKRDINSKSWLNRHVKDHYVQEAKKQDVRARSAFKLQEIQEKYKIIHKHDLVIDLGAAPGGWSVMASKWIAGGGQVIAVDLLPVHPIPYTTILQGDFTSPLTQQKLLEVMSGKQANVILSDMLQNTSGSADRDHFLSIELSFQALDFCQQYLLPSGHFICKYLQGEDEQEWLEEVKKLFHEVKVVKPKASRSESREVYLVARKKKQLPNNNKPQPPPQSTTTTTMS